MTIELLKDGEYVAAKHSRAFSKLTPALLLKWVKIGERSSYSVMLRSVEQWCAKL